MGRLKAPHVGYRADGVEVHADGVVDAASIDRGTGASLADFGQPETGDPAPLTLRGLRRRGEVGAEGGPLPLVQAVDGLRERGAGRARGIDFQDRLSHLSTIPCAAQAAWFSRHRPALDAP